MIKKYNIAGALRCIEVDIYLNYFRRFFSGKNTPTAAPLGLARAGAAATCVRLHFRLLPQPLRRKLEQANLRWHQTESLLPPVRGHHPAAPVLVAHVPPGADRRAA